jgi:hypothetical protein
MAKRKKTLRKLRRRLNQTTFLLVLGLGLVAMMTIVSDPTAMKHRQVPERDVASVTEGEFNRAPDAVKGNSVLTVECSEKPDIISWTQQVRLKGHLCQDDGKLSIISTQIQNTRNGYVATVFHQDREFTTDFIQLSEGENQLLVKHTLSDGKTEERKVTINRQ